VAEAGGYTQGELFGGSQESQGERIAAAAKALHDREANARSENRRLEPASPYVGLPRHGLRMNGRQQSLTSIPLRLGYLSVRLHVTKTGVPKMCGRIGIIAAVLTFPCALASAQTSQGTGNNFGSGWRSDGNGGYRGTGNNFGSGWQSDGNGGFRGTGNNFGSGWRSDGNGGYRGTGNNFGSGWQSR